MSILRPRAGLRPRALLPAAALLAGAGLLSGCGSQTSAGGFADSGTEACRELTRAGNVEETDRIVPGADSYSVSERVRITGDGYAGKCEVDAGGEEALLVTVDLKGFADYAAWEKYVTDNELVPSEGRKKLGTAGGGIATQTAAGIYVPCTVREDDGPAERGGLSVLAVAESGGEHREDLAAIAARAAKAAAAEGPCTS
jgi:hypothetical protein